MNRSNLELSSPTGEDVPTQNQELEYLLSQLHRQRFYGSLELKFEAGRVVLLRKSETLKLTVENYRNNRGKSDERT